MPQPLGSYLKALATLRLVAEQVDPEAKGCWEGGCFHLDSTLDVDDLLRFLLDEYRPTPLIAPWNGGSGFYPKDRKVGIDAIMSSTSSRFEAFREAVHFAREMPEVAAGKCESAKEDANRRSAILQSCRNGLPDACVDWLDAAISLDSEGNRAFAPILGTGGNEGRLDYTNNFMEWIAGLLLSPGKRAHSEQLLRNSLFGEAATGLEAAAVGQYDPGKAGGFNQGQGVTSDSGSNPWNFVLTLEGAVAWAGGVHRKQGVAYASYLCSPFTVRATAVGYGSSAEKDAVLSRAEIWVPIWSRPASYRELRALLREGRANVGKRPAETGLEFAEAASSLGVDRGIRGFVRYNLLKRRGDSYVALPAGEFDTTYRSSADLVRQMVPIVEDWHRSLRGASQYDGLRRQFDDAVFEALLHGHAWGLVSVARVFGRISRWGLTTGRRIHSDSKLPMSWVTSVHEVAEAQIGASIASMWGIREHLDRSNREFAWQGQDFCTNFASLIERRLLRPQDGKNLFGAGYRSSLASVSKFLLGSLDLEAIEDLMFAFLFVEWERASAPDEETGELPPIYALLRFPFLFRRAPDGDVVGPDLAMLTALRAEDIESAAEIALRKLRVHGYPIIDVAYGQGEIDPRLLTASLAIPAPYGGWERGLVMWKSENVGV